MVNIGGCLVDLQQNILITRIEMPIRVWWHAESFENF